MIATTGGDGWWKESRNAKKNLLPSTIRQMQDGSDSFIFYYQNRIYTAKVQGFFVTSK